MPLSRFLKPGGDETLLDAESDAAALLLETQEGRFLVTTQERLGCSARTRDLEEAVSAGDDLGAAVHLADLGNLAGDAPALHDAAGLMIWPLSADALEASRDALRVSETQLGRVFGRGQSDLVLLRERSAAARPAMRRLVGLPSERSSGLLPFLTAVGAEPYVLLDDAGPLIAELDRRGEGWVAVVAKPGAFLWQLDLRGREGLERQAAERIDADVLLPLTAGLDRMATIRIGGAVEDLVPLARSGAFDLAFVLPTISATSLAALEEEGSWPAFSCSADWPGGLRIS